MRIRKSNIITNWQIPRNPEGRLWKKNPKFKDTTLQKIINKIEQTQKVMEL